MGRILYQFAVLSADVKVSLKEIDLNVCFIVNISQYEITRPKPTESAVLSFVKRLNLLQRHTFKTFY